LNDGYVFLHRAIWDHPMFVGKEFSDLDAWIWLISSAAWKPTRVRIGRTVMHVGRGELIASERFLAAKWRWSKSRVNRFLRLLEIEAMATRKTDHGMNHLSICNYDQFQNVRTADRTRTGPVVGPELDHSWTKEEELKEDKKLKRTDSGAVATAPPPDSGKIFDEQFWSVYPRREGANPKAPARKAFITAVKNGNSPTAIVMGAQRYAADLMKSSKVGTPYVAQAVTWLHQRRWEDYPDVIAQPAGPPKPPDPSMPSDEQLRKKYGESHAEDRRDPQKGKGLRGEGAGVRREDGHKCPRESADDQAGVGGVEGVGVLFHKPFGLLPVGDDPRHAAASDGRERCSDDGPDTVAGMVRH
jgi:hypothetical protein